MTRTISKGTCMFCQTEYSKAGMNRHLEACKQRATLEALAENQQTTQHIRKIHLLVAGCYSPMYWMHLDIISSTMGRDLTALLQLADVLDASRHHLQHTTSNIGLIFARYLAGMLWTSQRI